MIGLNHVLTGTTIALIVKQPLLAAPLAFLSHFFLDITPHFGGTAAYEFGHKWFPYIMAADAIISAGAILLICSLVPSMAAIIVLCVLCAILPDVLLLHYYTHGRPQSWFHRAHLGMQWFERPPGAIVEASYLVLVVSVIFAVT